MKRARAASRKTPAPDGKAIIARVLTETKEEVDAARVAYEKKAKAARNAGKKPKPFKPELNFAIGFAKYIGIEVANAFNHEFPGIKSGETPSQAVRGLKRVDVNYSTTQAGLGFALSFKSVHQGERDSGNGGFIHNMKRNDEELRVEATGHHLRQPFAVMAAVVFLPFESCKDMETSSFACWVEYLWPLKGRQKPDDPPDRYELVFIGLYARDGSDLGFYEVGGNAPCPRTGRPKLLSFAAFLKRVKETYDERNGRDFFFAGEKP